MLSTARVIGYAAGGDPDADPKMRLSFVLRVYCLGDELVVRMWLQLCAPRATHSQQPRKLFLGGNALDAPSSLLAARLRSSDPSHK